jgi:3-phosphoshikimate 1-carboxyvinyltransferase
LEENSKQGDRAILRHLQEIKAGTPTISAKDIPDLVPILAVAAAANRGAVITDIQRLRLKESDRVETTCNMIKNLGGKVEATEESLTVLGTGLIGGTVDSCNDHRIAMAAAIASTVCTKPVTVLGADAVNKSYPRFWEEFARLGGYYELYLR